MIIDKLKHDAELLAKQIYWLEFSFKECQLIGLKESYQPDEFGKFETLCSRYSRSIDFLIRKMFRTIDEFELENQGTLIDVVNNAAKRGLVNDVEQIREMKDVRNTIVHEYVEEELIATFEEVLHFSFVLIQLMKQTERYVQSVTN